MSIAAISLSARPLSDQQRTSGASKIPPARILVAKGDPILIPEPR
jgi:hypothetical protein